MIDGTYQPKVRMVAGGDQQVIASGGAINVESGGKILADGTQAANIADVSIAAVTGVDGTGSNAAAKADVDTAFSQLQAKINAIVAALEGAGIVAAS